MTPTDDDQTPRPYRPTAPAANPSAEELRSRIPGWGVDLDPADRPSVPRERLDPDLAAGWEPIERQPEERPRERSIEHGMLPPVFGTAQPLHGLSGAVRRLAYARYSEGRLAHWLLLVLGDRIDVVGGVARSVATGHPELPLVGTGLRGELDGRGVRERLGSTRADTVHHALDPLVVAGPWLLGGWLAVRATRSLTRRGR